MPLSLRLHHLGRQNCYTIITTPPQRRTILLNYYDEKVGELIQPKSLFFPHMTFIFHYRRVPLGFKYGGLEDYGLMVLCTKKAIKSLKKDKFFVLPIEPNGFSCTDHSFDGKVFSKPYLLVGTILKLWWSMPAYIYTRRDNDFMDWTNLKIPENMNEINFDKWHGSIHNDKLKNKKWIDKLVKLPSLELPAYL